MMNMEWSILPGYAREEEIRELFTEYTNMVLAGDPPLRGTWPGSTTRMNWPTPPANTPRPTAGCTWCVRAARRWAAPRSRRWMTPAAR